MKLFVFGHSTLQHHSNGLRSLKEKIPFDMNEGALVIMGDEKQCAIDSLYKTLSRLTGHSAVGTPTITKEHSAYTIYQVTAQNSSPSFLVLYNAQFMQCQNILLTELHTLLSEQGTSVSQTNLYTDNFHQHIATKSLKSNVTSHFVTPHNPFKVSMHLPNKPTTNKEKSTKPSALIGQFSQTFRAKDNTQQTEAPQNFARAAVATK